MRTLILVLALTLLPCGANAASIKDFDGKWVADLAATLEKRPELNSKLNKQQLPKLMFTLDVKAGTIGMEYSGQPGSVRSFAVEREGPDGVVLRLDNDRVLKLQPHGKDRVAVGELYERVLSDVIYFTRPQSPRARPAAPDKTLPARPRPSFAPPAKKNP